MAGQLENNRGLVGQVLPILLVILVGAGTGFAGFKAVGIPTPKAPDVPKLAAPVKTTPQTTTKPEKTDGITTVHGDKATPSNEEAEKQTHEAALLAEEMRARKVELAETTIVPISPIIANIANPSTTWIRMEATLAVSKAATAKPADIAQMVSPRILAYLKTLKIADLQSASGMQFVSADIDEIARTASTGQVRSVLLTGFVIE